MSRLDPDITDIRNMVSDLEEYLDDAGYSILGDINANLDSIESEADEMEDELEEYREMDLDDLRRIARDLDALSTDLNWMAS
jgi:uncharacterized protein YbjQ (UPF0145 family)